MSIDWNRELVDQLEWHWDNQLRPRLDGLTDEEYRWEPVPGCWNVRPRERGKPGPFTIDFDFPPPTPTPVTTIAWRVAHLVVGVLGMRNANHFGAAPDDYRSHAYPGDAATALAELDENHAVWVKGVRNLGADGLARACGPAEGPYAESSMAALVLHIHREVIHHGAESALLRDLYAHR